MITLGPQYWPGRHPFADAQGSAQPLPDMRPTRQDRERTIGLLWREGPFLITSYQDPTNFIEQKGLVGTASQVGIVLGLIGKADQQQGASFASICLVWEKVRFPTVGGSCQVSLFEKPATSYSWFRAFTVISFPVFARAGWACGRDARRISENFDGRKYKY